MTGRRPSASRGAVFVGVMNRRTCDTSHLTMTVGLTLHDAFMMHISNAPTLILCADDYGLSPGIGRSIRELISDGRLSATSCMTLFPEWPDEAARLRPLDGKADIGLHLTLTDHPPLGPMPRLAPDGRMPGLGALMRLSLTGRLPTEEIAAELERQLAAFIDAFGRPPDHLDGHQHVHQLPGVRGAVIATARRLGPAVWVRSCREPVGQILARRVFPLKATVISLLGLGMPGAPGNRGFRGVYDFTDRIPRVELLRRFLTPATNGALVMVHPGYVDAILRERDQVVEAREAEHALLAGDALPRLLDTAGARVGRWREAGRRR